MANNDIYDWNKTIQKMTLTRTKYPTKETKCIDDCICVYCGHKFDGHNATNGDLDTVSVECPKCGREMFVIMSVEYICQQIENQTEN